MKGCTCDFSSPTVRKVVRCFTTAIPQEKFFKIGGETSPENIGPKQLCVGV